MTCNPRAAADRACLRLCACLACLGVAPLLAQDVTSFVAAEYFWDNDLVTNHVAVAISSDQTVALGYPSGAQFNIDLTTLPAGFHQLGLRFRMYGAWTERQLAAGEVFDPATLVNTPSITSIGDSGTWLGYAEYFWDSAPGLSNGTPVSVAPGETFGLGYPGALATNLDLSGLPLGLHNLGFRTIDNLGRVSQTNWLPVQVFDPATLVNTPSITSIGDSGTWLSYAEYFWDSAPGLSNGTPVSVAPGETFGLGYPGALATNLDMSGLPLGLHNLGFRTIDNLGRVSQTNWLPVQVFDPATLVNTPSITSIGDSGTWLSYAEYFWDGAPGLSNGTPVSVAPGETFGLGYPGALATNLDFVWPAPRLAQFGFSHD